MNRRAQYIRDHYKLERTADGWRAVSNHGGISNGRAWHSHSEITDSNRATLIARVRREWGHFNFEDEAEAFAEVFR